ncbi:trigger factor [Psittacicella hinzii]|uniref:Trigger factor n=1 Tax=Psittacicella hinzii TaxID=2028575 RepID=A0A3A1YTJ7_9GAMM|nr:trigger factor [Psittacicella hinzii]RIY39367.1 trigger factor [Psittacicella hinzii]
MSSFKLVSSEGLTREVKLSISRDLFEKEYNKEVKKLVASKKLSLPGFRPGKVPLSVAEPYVRQDASNAAAQKLENEAFTAYLKTSEERPIIINSRKADWVEEGKELEVTLNFDVAPKVELKDFSNVEVEFPVISEESAVEEMILALRQQRSTYELKDKAAALDDLVIFESEATDENGLPYAAFTGKNNLVVGSYQYPADFSGDFVGRKAGDEFETKFKVSEDKEFNLKVKVLEVKERTLGEVDEAFISEFLNKKNATLDDLKAEIKKNLKREIKAHTLKYFLNRTDEKFLELYSDLEVSKGIVDFYVYRRFEAYLLNTTPSNQPRLSGKELFDATNELMKKDPDTVAVLTNEERNNLRIELVHEALVRDLNITVTDEEVEQYIEDLSVMFEDPIEYKHQSRKNKQLLESSRNEVLSQKVALKLKTLFKLKEVEMPYTDLVRINQGQDLA